MMYASAPAPTRPTNGPEPAPATPTPRQRPRAPYLFFLVMALFFVVMASRVTRLTEFETDRDELLSIQRAQADTFENLLLWLPNDWPPLYFAALGGWAGLVGLHPVYLRFGSVLVALVGYACMYQLGRRLGGPRAGLLVMLAYAALSYNIVLDLKLRGYVIVSALLPAAVWLTLHYFDRPNWRRAVPLALTFAVMFYSTYISALLFMVIGVLSLCLYGRRVLAWWRIGVIAGVLAAPEALRKLAVAYDVATSEQPGQSFTSALTLVFTGWTGYYAGFWLVLIGIATALLWRRPRWLAAFAFWIVGLPALMYFLLDPRFTFTQRYAFWAMGGIALLVGWGVSRLPRAVTGGVSVGLIALMFAPVPPPDFFTFEYTDTFAWLRQNVRAGDVFIIDPQCACPEPRELNFYIRRYFPDTGLRLVDHPGEHRRVWYISGGRSGVDERLFEATRAGRVSMQFFGPTDFLFRLYEAPPDPDGIAFENGLRFHGVDFIDPVDDTPWFGPLEPMENSTLRLRLWWSADRPIDADYSIATHIGRGRTPVTQVDGPPQLIDPRQPPETSQWRTDRYYIEERDLTVPLAGGSRHLNFNIWLTVYQWWDGVRIPGEATNDADLLRLARMRVKTS